jgi:hypothetical protein
MNQEISPRTFTSPLENKQPSPTKILTGNSTNAFGVGSSEDSDMTPLTVHRATGLILRGVQTISNPGVVKRTGGTITSSIINSENEHHHS